MPDWNLVDRNHVLAAIKEFDRLGSREFYSRYQFGRAPAHTLWHGGQEYDPHAIVGLAYLRASGRAATRGELRDVDTGAGPVLQGLGFDVVVDQDALEQEQRQQAARELEPATTTTAAGVRAATPRKAAARKPAAKKSTRVKPAEAPVKLCPTCYTALPATGICDFCD